MDKFTKPANDAMASLEKHAKTYKRAGKEITKTGKEITAVGSAMTKGITTPIVAIGAASVKAGIDFESAFAGVKKTLDVSDLEKYTDSQERITKELGNMRKGIVDLSKEIPMTASDIAGIAESAGQLGIERDNILSFTKAIADLSVATNLTSDEAASKLAKYANVTKMSQKDFEKLGATIVDLGNHYATTEADIVSMATRIAGAGNQIGLTDGEIMGFSAALSSVGIEAEMGGSAFSKAMIKMKVATATGLTQVQEISQKTGKSLRDLQLLADNDTKGFKDLAAGLGMTKTELNNVVKSGVELEHFSKIAGMTTTEFKKLFDANPAKALDGFIKGLGDTKGAGKSTIEMLQNMGFTEVRLRDSLTRMANGSELVTSAMERGNQAWEEGTALVNEANQRYETTESKLKMLGNSLAAAGMDICEILLPSIMEVAGVVGDAVNAFSNLDEGTKKTIIKIAGLAAAAGPSIMIFGKMTSGVGRTITAIGNLGTGLGGMHTRAKQAMQVLKKIEMPEFGFKMKTKNISDKMKNVFGKIKLPKMKSKMPSIELPTIKGAGKISSILSKVKSGVGKGISLPFKLLSKEFSLFGKITGKLFSPLTKLLSPLKKVGSLAVGLGKAMFTFLGPAGSVVLVLGAIVAAGILVYKNWDKIKKAAKALGDRIKSVFLSSGIDVKKLGETFEKMKETVGTAVGNAKIIIGSIKEALQPIVEFVGGVFLTGIETGFDAVVGFASGLFDGIVETTSGILEALGGVTTFLSGVFTGDWEKALEGISDIFGGIFKGLVGLAKTPINAIIGLFNGAIDGINQIKVPDWVPGIGGEGINIPKIPMLARGTMNWQGGPVMVHDRGAEIIDLPSGSRVYPHDKSMQMARNEGKNGGNTYNVYLYANDMPTNDKAKVKKWFKECLEEMADRIERESDNYVTG